MLKKTDRPKEGMDNISKELRWEKLEFLVEKSHSQNLKQILSKCEWNYLRLTLMLVGKTSEKSYDFL